jgi:hypothetical protein
MALLVEGLKDVDGFRRAGFVAQDEHIQAASLRPSRDHNRGIPFIVCFSLEWFASKYLAFSRPGWYRKKVGPHFLG